MTIASLFDLLSLLYFKSRAGGFLGATSKARLTAIFSAPASIDLILKRPTKFLSIFLLTFQTTDFGIVVVVVVVVAVVAVVAVVVVVVVVVVVDIDPTSLNQHYTKGR